MSCWSSCSCSTRAAASTRCSGCARPSPRPRLTSRRPRRPRAPPSSSFSIGWIRRSSRRASSAPPAAARPARPTRRSTGSCSRPSTAISSRCRRITCRTRSSKRSRRRTAKPSKKSSSRHKDVPRRRRWRSFWQKPRFCQAALVRAGCPDPAPSKRIADPGEHRRSLAAVADIDITHDERPRDAPEADTDHLVQLRRRPGIQPREHPADIEERRHLQIEASRGDAQRPDSLAQLDGRRECVAIVEPSGAIAAQRLGAADQARAAAEGAERPERGMPGLRHVPRAVWTARMLLRAIGQNTGRRSRSRCTANR